MQDAPCQSGLSRYVPRSHSGSPLSYGHDRLYGLMQGIYKELITIGVAKDSNETDSLVNASHEWISKEESRRHPQPEF